MPSSEAESLGLKALGAFKKHRRGDNIAVTNRRLKARARARIVVGASRAAYRPVPIVPISAIGRVNRRSF
jgi:hypothetical protein